MLMMFHAAGVMLACERLLHDGSMAAIRLVVDDRSRQSPALAYLAALGVSTP